MSSTASALPALSVLAHQLVLVLVGAAAGILGTIVGLGGGFIIIPILRLVYGVEPAHVAGISLVTVLANAVSGSLVYFKQRRADVKMAVLVAATGIPASLLGAAVVHQVSVAGFDLLYGALLIYFFIDLMRRRNAGVKRPRFEIKGLRDRVLVDAAGESFHYLTNTPLVLACGLMLGFVSSFFGIGGGVIFVMFFIAMFRMPPHVVIATSTLAILLTTPIGVGAHLVARDIDWAYALPLSIGGLIGGQVGPRVAKRLSGPRLLTVLAVVLLIAAVSLVVKHL